MFSSLNSYSHLHRAWDCLVLIYERQATEVTASNQATPTAVHIKHVLQLKGFGNTPLFAHKLRLQCKELVYEI